MKEISMGKVSHSFFNFETFISHLRRIERKSAN